MTEDLQNAIENLVEKKGDELILKLTEFCKENKIYGDALELVFLAQGIKLGADFGYNYCLKKKTKPIANGLLEISKHAEDLADALRDILEDQGLDVDGHWRYDVLNRWHEFKSEN